VTSVDEWLVGDHPLHALSSQQASELLEAFLSFGAAGRDALAELLMSRGRALSYELDSLPMLFESVLPVLSYGYRSFSATVPDWIKAVPQHAKGDLTFSHDAHIWIMRLSFHLGHCFIDSFPQLRWGTGNRKTALANMPVVLGFQSCQELPVFSVSKNLFIRLIRDSAPLTVVSEMTKSWAKSAL
jgi:hypothetical protein